MINLAQDRDVLLAVVYVPLGFKKCREISD
jgi:hypothetical protein